MLPIAACCWYGMKNHCVFCGLYRAGMDFQRKSPEQVPDLLRRLSSRYGTRYFNAIDNTLGPTPLPELVRLAKIHWRIEHGYHQLKTGWGLDHFEPRTWRGWHRHVTLVIAAQSLVTLLRTSPKRLRRPEPLRRAAPATDPARHLGRHLHGLRTTRPPPNPEDRRNKAQLGARAGTVPAAGLRELTDDCGHAEPAGEPAEHQSDAEEYPELHQQD